MIFHIYILIFITMQVLFLRTLEIEGDEPASSSGATARTCRTVRATETTTRAGWHAMACLIKERCGVTDYNVRLAPKSPQRRLGRGRLLWLSSLGHGALGLDLGSSKEILVCHWSHDEVKIQFPQDPAKTLWIGNIPKNAKWKDLQALAHKAFFRCNFVSSRSGETYHRSQC